MDRKEIESKVIECVSITFKRAKGELSIDTNFKSELGGASILMVGLASLLENELDVLVPLPVVASCKTIKDLADRVEEML